MILASALIGALLQGAVLPAAHADDLPGVPAAEKPMTGHDLKMSPRPTKGAPGLPKTAPKHAWPASGAATVTLQPGTKAAAVRAGSSPVSLKAPAAPKTAKKTSAALSGQATVRVLDHASARRAGVDGMLFSLARATAATGNAVQLNVDYSAFSQAYGGAYAARVKLVRLPACAATTPKVTSCTTPTPVPTRNDVSTHTLTAASVSLPASGQAALFGVESSTSSDQGDYKATSLSASAAWSTNLSTGDFSWSYPMPTPSVPGNFSPSVSLAYDSGSIDGRTANSNNQGSWAGDGFSLWPGSIERSYKPCADDNVTNANGQTPGDECWAYDNATLSFNGHSGELIAVSGDSNSFRLKDDDGTRIDRIYGDSTNVRANGAHNDEYWRVTTTDGTRYYFGYNRLPNWTTGDPVTNSTWTVPVYGDDDNEPCHASTFEASWCQQGWRWNLDYAVDVHGNAIAYYYDKETNTYARNLTAADETAYDRGGTLNHIDYGLRDSSVYTGKALARVDFTSAERCLDGATTCDPSTIDTNSSYWYDTPWDLNCPAGQDCDKSSSPSFWTRKRLTDVTTSVLKPDSSGYNPIDTWHLEHGWGMADIDYQLELQSITHTGLSATPNIALPPVTFTYDQRTNRLDIPGDNTSPFIKERVSTIDDESGGQIDVTYSTATCDADNLPTPDANTTRCYPSYFTKEGDQNPTLQWFNKYVVDAVTRTDRTNSSPDMVIRYSYLDGAAWHYDDDDGLTKEKYKTWSTWRGYGHVRVETGGQDPIGMESQTDHYFLRGMDGDKDSTSPVTVSDDHGGTITDDDAVAGFEYKTEQYSGPGGDVLYKTVNTPWHYTTATRTRSWGTTTANLTGTAGTRTWTSLDNGAGTQWRTTNKTNSFENTAGRVTQTDDFGDESTSTDNRCTRTTYADNTSAWILIAVARVETVAVKCDDQPDRSKDVISDVRTAYDDLAYGAAPTKGDPTHVATLKSDDGTTATYIESGTTYDTTYGRPLTVTDITATVTATETTEPVRTDRSDGRTTTTDYSPATGFPTTVTVTTPPATPGTATTAQTTKTTYDTLRGLPATTLDANNKRTDFTYDALGRGLRVWLPNRSKANNEIPNYQFTYTDTDNQPVAIGTATLKSSIAQQTSYALYDGFLRTRETQTPGHDGGRLVTDTFYDERGLVAKSFAPYYNVDPPSGDGILTLDQAQAVETQTWNTYDGLGRALTSQQVAGNSDGGQVLATNTTAYGGDRVTVTPPQGATPTTTITDARGNTTDLLQYHATTPTGSADTTHYDYTPAGKLHQLTDPSGTVWTYGYDLRGNQTSADDPDKGHSTSVYDDRNQLVSTTDARDQTITHIYDGLGRETETHNGDATGPLLTKHVWDPTGYKGQLASATRYVTDGTNTLAYTTTHNFYDTLYRPTRTTITIPKDPSHPEEDALAKSYQMNTAYNANGTVQSYGYPAAGSLTAETLVPDYDPDTLLPTTLTGSGSVTYITGTTYSDTGKPLIYHYQSGSKEVQVTNTYEWGTQRLHNSRVDRQDVPGTDRSATYGYDQAGNVTSISDTSRDGTDNQCFQYDYVQRLTEAWAQSDADCATDPSTAVLGGPAPYWNSYTYELSGDRKTDTIHDPAGVAANDIHHAYTYPTPTSSQPHTLNEVDTSGPSGISADTYTYDDDGNTRTRTIGGNTQTLDWDAEGHLSEITSDDGSGGTTTLASYIYDADGNRLISRDTNGTTLYLGETEVTLPTGTTTPQATRYYDLGSGNQAIRTDDGTLSFLIGDHLGTAELAIAASDLTMQQRRTTPFGAPRGTAPTSWPGTKGFVGGTQETATGLTHLGARDYDPTTGRFLSTDPLLDTGDPQSLNGYAYSDNNPATLSDPDGTHLACGGQFAESCPTTDHNGDDIADTNQTTSGSGGNNDTCPSITNSMCPEYAGDTTSTDPGDGTQDPPPVNIPPEWTQPGHGYSFLGFCILGVDTEFGCVHGKWAWKAVLDTDLAVLKGLSGYDDIVSCSKGNWKGCTWTVVDGIGYLSAAGKVAGVVRDAKGIALVDALAGCKLSFSPGTQVLMAHGKKKAIKDIKPGEQVESADPRDGKHSGSRTVTARIISHDHDLIDLKLTAPDGHTVTVHTTSRHPFWDDTAHEWIPAGRLTPGHLLNTPNGGHARVLTVKPTPGAAAMYNLTVEQLHTYYVLAGSTPILVHNANCGLSLKDLAKDYPRRTVGILDVGSDQLPMVSGPGGQSELLNSLPGRTKANFNHVETHAAAFLRMNPGIRKAVLYIDYPTGACPTCADTLPEMLPEGVQLWVISPGKTERYVGLSD